MWTHKVEAFLWSCFHFPFLYACRNRITESSGICWAYKGLPNGFQRRRHFTVPSSGRVLHSLHINSSTAGVFSGMSSSCGLEILWDGTRWPGDLARSVQENLSQHKPTANGRNQKGKPWRVLSVLFAISRKSVIIYNLKHFSGLMRWLSV